MAYRQLWHLEKRSNVGNIGICNGVSAMKTAWLKWLG